MSLEIDSEQIRVADPLFAKVLVTNTTDAEITYKKPFSAGFGTIQFEMLGPGNDLPVPAHPQGGGLDDTHTAPFTLGAGETVATHEILSWSTDGPVFARPGRYTLRAFAKRDEMKSFSNRIDVEVRPRDQAEIDRIKESRSLARGVITTTGISQFVDRNELNVLILKLGESNLRSALIRARELIELVKATDERQRQKEQADINKLMQESHPVIAEIMALQLAGYYMNHRKPLEAEAALRGVPVPSFQSDSIKAEVEYQKRGGK